MRLYQYRSTTSRPNCIKYFLRNAVSMYCIISYIKRNRSDVLVGVALVFVFLSNKKILVRRGKHMSDVHLRTLTDKHTTHMHMYLNFEHKIAWLCCVESRTIVPMFIVFFFLHTYMLSILYITVAILSFVVTKYLSRNLKKSFWPQGGYECGFSLLPE